MPGQSETYVPWKSACTPQREGAPSIVQPTPCSCGGGGGSRGRARAGKLRAAGLWSGAVLCRWAAHLPSAGARPAGLGCLCIKDTK